MPTSLHGPHPAMATSDLDAIKIPGSDAAMPARRRSLHTLWDHDTSSLGRGMRAAFDTVDRFEPVRRAGADTARYPASDLGRALAGVARLVRGSVGTRVVTVDQGDWDHHQGLGTLSWGAMRENAHDLASSVAAFFADLGPRADQVTMVVLSEFGRRVQENANHGLDHGHGTVMLAVGAGVRGGYYARWPGLTASEDSDLRVTTDYRDVLADVVEARFGASIARVFPGLSHRRVGFMSRA